VVVGEKGKGKSEKWKKGMKDRHKAAQSLSHTSLFSHFYSIDKDMGRIKV
jgi:hypothetical protein